MRILTVWLMTVVCAQAADVSVGRIFMKKAVAVAGFGGGASVAGQVAGVLKNDLQLSGFFEIKSAAEAEFVQQGNVRVQGGVGYVDCTVTLRANNKVILSKTYQGSVQDLRR